MSTDPRSHGFQETQGPSEPAGGDWTGRELALGRYEVTQRLGEGGFGVVYQARDRKLSRTVVIKVPHVHLLGSPGFAARFAREIHSLVELDHPRICTILDADEHQGVPYAVVKFLAGGSLQDRRPKDNRGEPLPVPLERAIAWIAPVAEALDFVHRKHYVHRDVKPANILFDGEGNVYLSDFGIAKALAAEADTAQNDALTATGAWIGTPAYMAHEVFFGRKHLPPADQYALAVVVYELLTGRRPFLGPPTAIAALQVAKPPLAVHELVGSLPEAVGEAVQRALSNDPDGRYASCRGLLDAIEAGRRPARASSARESGGKPAARTTKKAAPSPPGPRPPEPAPPPESIVLECPACRQKLRFGPIHAGEEVLCPACQGRLQVSTDGRRLTLLAPPEKPRGDERFIANSLGMRLALIPAGDFLMGSPNQDTVALDWEKPQHRVRIARPFYLSVDLVTQAEYQRVMGANPSHFKGDPRRPVEQVSWENAQEFCRKLSALSEERAARHVYRLPTEAQWEYACRAGAATRWCFGDDERRLGEHAWFAANAGNQTHSVGQRKANAWGLNDMHGNVGEWCEDWFGKDYYAKCAADDPPGPPSGSHRVARGGGWSSPARHCRSACRSILGPGARSRDLGFRVCRAVGP